MTNLYIVVETYDLLGDELEACRVIDHNDRDDRRWLGRHCFWAMRNNKRIVTYAGDTPHVDAQ